MRSHKLALLAAAATISLLSIFPAASHAVQNAANFIGDITLKQDAGLNTGIYFSNGSYQNTASPWHYSGLDIYFNSVGAAVSIGGLPSGAATFQVYNTTTSGQAALFQINNGANVLPALYSTTNGNGQAVFGLNSGTGRAGHFMILNSGSSSSALVAETSGTGYAGEFLGKLKVTGSITFSDASTLSTAKTDCNGGRYEDNGNGTISDCRTGLIWLKNANCTATAGGIAKTTLGTPVGALSWDDAKTWTAGLGSPLCGLSDLSSAGDWRLPTKTEWMAMLASARKQGFVSPALTNSTGTAMWTPGDPFDSVISGTNYWSGTTSVASDVFTWSAYTGNGSVGMAAKVGFNFYVWPVRSGL